MFNMLKQTMVAAALLLVSVAHADTKIITQWDFNSRPADSSNSTGNANPAIGSGSITLLGGVTNPGFNSGSGSSDTASDNTGFQTTSYRAQSVGSKTAGVEFRVSTLGYTDIAFRYDLRHSNTSSRYEQLQYSLDGSSFLDAIRFDGNKGDSWFNGRSFSLASIAGASNNPNLAFRVLASFAPDTNTYAPSNASSTYGASGTWRFDMVTVSGVSAVPEPESYAMLLAGLGVVILLSLRSSRS